MTTSTIIPGAGFGTVVGEVVGAASVGAALSDGNDNSYIRSDQSVIYMTSFALPAQAVIKQFRTRVRMLASADATVAIETATVPTLNPLVSSRVIPVTGSTTPVEDVSPWVTVVLNQQQFDDLQLRLRTMPGVYSNWQLVRFLEASIEVMWVPRPIVYPTAPSGLVLNTNRPTVTWQFSAGSDAEGGQVGFRVKVVNSSVFNSPQYQGAGGFNIEAAPGVLDTGFVAGAATSFNIPNALPPSEYRAFIQVYQATNSVQQASEWSAAVFTIAPPSGAPTDMVPVNGGTILTSRPVLDASVAYNLGINYKRHWEFSPVSNFASGVITVVDTVPIVGSRPFPFPSDKRLAQGLWYGRVKTLDPVDASSPWSATNVFVVAHAPSTTNRKPSGAKAQPYATTVKLSWQFTDPDANDQQVKYRVQLWKITDPVGSLQDSGEQTSGNQFHNFTSLNSTWKDVELRWRVQVWDVDQVSSGWSSEQGFFLRDPATINITSPTNNQVINTPTPLITWTFVGSGGRTQAQWRVTLRNLTTGVDVLSSGWQSGAATSWQVLNPVISVGPSWRATLEVVDSAGITSVTTRNFTANYAQPAGPVFNVTSVDYPDLARITVEWSGATPSGTFVAWRVYRRVNSGDWTMIYETTNVSTRIFDDYAAPSGQLIEYTVVQALTSSGVTIETIYDPDTVSAELGHYMLTCPDNPELNLHLFHVTGESFGDEQEMATMNLIGRGRRVEYGERFGHTGSLNVSFRDHPTMTARDQRVRLEALRDSGLAVYLLNPFGDVFRVAMMSAQITRVPGMGRHEMATASIDYSEITA